MLISFDALKGLIICKMMTAFSVCMCMCVLTKVQKQHSVRIWGIYQQEAQLLLRQLSRYDKINDSGGSANPNRKYDLRKFHFTNRIVNTRNSVCCA